MNMLPSATLSSSSNGHLVVIGASTGGVRALCVLFDHLPALNAAVLVVQHMPRYIQPSFIKTLREHTPMAVDFAREGELAQPGQVLLAPADVHCTLEQNRRVRLVAGPQVNYVCPSVDVTMKSVGQPATPGSLVGVLLTGMGRDGADGMVHLKKLGAKTVAQDQASCAVFGMPKEAWNAGGVDLLLPPERIARMLLQWMGRLAPANLPRSYSARPTVPSIEWPTY
jgi:two-component system chemotaxis response regulator CheB